MVIGTTQNAAMRPNPNVATETIARVIQLRTAAAVYMPRVPVLVAAGGGG